MSFSSWAKPALAKITKPVEDLTINIKAPPKRIVAFDTIRGLFLAVILIDHVQLYPSVFDFFTGQGRLYVSAAEGFFFMSGLLVGIVYKRRIMLGMSFIFKKMWQRALELYVASVVLTLFFTEAALKLNRPGLKYGLPSQPVDWLHTIGQTLLMRYGYGWTDFLDRFALLMLLAPFGFYLIAKGRWKLLAAISFIAWCFRGTFSPYDFTISWQFIFLMSMVMGFHWQKLNDKFNSLKTQTRLKIKKAVVWVTAISFSISWASVFLLKPLNDHYNQLTPWLQSFTHGFNDFNSWVWLYAQKWTQGPIRLILFFFWFAVLFMFVQKHQKSVHRFTRGVFDLLGSNSLFVYIAQGFIVFALKLFFPNQINIGVNFVITLASLILLTAITVLYRRHYHVLVSKKAHLYQKLPWVPANIEP